MAHDSAALQRHLSGVVHTGRSLIKPWQLRSGHVSRCQWQRQLHNAAVADQSDFAFAFDIDGVLLRSNAAIPGARDALRFLQVQDIPFIFLTNGGGRSEQDRVDDLQDRLHLRLESKMLMQSHTPFAAMDQFKDGTILVIGGMGDKCRHVAHSYGFKSVVTPADIIVQYPAIWPFSSQFLDYYQAMAQPLPKPIQPEDPVNSLQIDAIFVYNDPRDWGLDAAIILDALLSHKGILGTVSPKNGDSRLANKGYQQDGQPPLYYSNPDLWWAAEYHLPRLGQGGFREAFHGLWDAVTGGTKNDVKLQQTLIGKPFQLTYEFAEKILLEYRQNLFAQRSHTPLKTVYMIGDNPESDIKGGNSFKSPNNTKWHTVLVQTGVYQTGQSSGQPSNIVKDVYDAVQWALEREAWPSTLTRAQVN